MRLLNHMCKSYFLLIITRIMERKYQCELGIMALGILALGIMSLGTLALGIMALGKLSCNQIAHIKFFYVKIGQVNRKRCDLV